MRHRRERPIPFLLEVVIEQDGFRAGIIAIEQHGRARYLLDRPGTEIRVNSAPSAWDARRRIRAWIKAHHGGKP